MVGLILNHTVETTSVENADMGDARPRFLGLHKQSEDHVRRSRLWR
jgi:hypothetical protein